MLPLAPLSVFFFFNDTAPSEIYTLSLHDALPICFREIADDVGALLLCDMAHFAGLVAAGLHPNPTERSEEHTSELQSRGHLVCRLLLEKKKKHTSPNDA